MLAYCSAQAAGAAIASAAKTYKLKSIDVDISHLNDAGPNCITNLVAATITGPLWGNTAVPPLLLEFCCSSVQQHVLESVCFQVKQCPLHGAAHVTL